MDVFLSVRCMGMPLGCKPRVYTRPSRAKALWIGWLFDAYGTKKGSKIEIFIGRGGQRGSRKRIKGGRGKPLGLFWVGKRLWAGPWGFGDQLGGCCFGHIYLVFPFFGLGGAVLIDGAEGVADNGLGRFSLIEHGHELNGIMDNGFAQGPKGHR